MANLLILSLALPLFGALAMWPLAALGGDIAKRAALAVALATMLVACFVAGSIPAEGGAYAVYESEAVGTGLDIHFHVGLDGVSVWMYALSSILMFSSVLVSWDSINDRQPLFYAMLLLLECGCLGVFAARDVILFYVFFEFTLIPLFFLIGIWGSEDRRHAAIKFFLYTLAGSVLTFLGLLSIVIWDRMQTGGAFRFSIPELAASLAAAPLPTSIQAVVFWALFAGFAIKVPLFPLHTWLPLAHVQAPTAGSVFLAGILLKIGAYGFLRFSLPMLPNASAAYAPWLVWLSVAGIIYGALVALSQGDIKKLIAYSSVSHLGYCILGLFALNAVSVQGGALQMVNHGISTGALFAMIGMIYRRRHTRLIKQLQGLATSMPCLAFFMVFFTFSSIGLPGLNGFPGEIMVLLGTFQSGWSDPSSPWGQAIKWAAVLSVSGVVLGAWYMLWLVQRVMFGPPGAASHSPDAEHADAEADSDLNIREVAALAPLAVLALWIGLWPQFFMGRMNADLQAAVAPAIAQIQAAHAPSGSGEAALATFARRAGRNSPRDMAIASPTAAETMLRRDDTPAEETR